MLNFLWFLIFGLIIGAVAKLIMPGSQGSGWLSSLLFGVIGAVVGGWIASAIFGIATTSSLFHLPSVLFAIVGALIVMFVWGVIQQRSSRV